jgi:hypothetical protein
MAITAITDHPGWFAIDVAGRYVLDDAQMLIHRILSEAKARQRSRVLVNLLQMEGDIPDWERFFLGVATAEVLGSAIQIAVVAQGDKINYFWENTAVIRGVRAGVFSNRQSAEAWLLRGTAPAVPAP